MLNWQVFRYDINKKRILTWNVFEHGSFYKDAIKCLNECRDKEEFKTELRREVQYYFWAKVEYEVFISEPFPYVSKEEIERLSKEDVKYYTHVNLDVGSKIDIYEQIMMNYKHFVNYVWENGKNE